MSSGWFFWWVHVLNGCGPLLTYSTKELLRILEINTYSIHNIFSDNSRFHFEILWVPVVEFLQQEVFLLGVSQPWIHFSGRVSILKKVFELNILKNYNDIKVCPQQKIALVSWVRPYPKNSPTFCMTYCDVMSSTWPILSVVAYKVWDYVTWLVINQKISPSVTKRKNPLPTKPPFWFSAICCVFRW